MSIIELLEETVRKGASDLHLIENLPPTFRIDGDLVPMRSGPLTSSDLTSFLEELLTREKKKKFFEEKELDFAYEFKGRARFRINVYMQRGSIALAIRCIPYRIPRLEDLGLPPILRDLTRRQSGLILVTGPTGSGKSTTLASMINQINEERSVHIVTVEDPIEYVYIPQKSVISQREVGEDTHSFANALKHVLRQDPDVILIGEMRDLETMQAAITAAETGHLVFSTLHTTSAPQTVDRIIDVFPPHQQAQIRSQLSITLEAVVSQRLLKRVGGGRIPACEILICTPAIRNLIREGKTYQLYSAMELGREYGMQTMEDSLSELLRKRQITKEEATFVARIVEYVRA
ncbi:MAG: type IV pilus twitching motility protein PilT [Desulfobacterota bacterium]|nr:type IV pilus twitching motility protein PilT [Thermodesulfobacteriota bacterium]